MGQWKEFWKDSKNWAKSGLYNCKEDPRLIVPKRIPLFGWTINAAHRASWIVWGGMIFVMVIPIIYLAMIRNHDLLLHLTVVSVLIAGVCVFCAWMARDRSG